MNTSGPYKSNNVTSRGDAIMLLYGNEYCNENISSEYSDHSIFDQ